MRAGHGVEPLDVVPGEAMGGYADRTAGVSGTLDPLEVHAVTFAGDGHRFALVVADLVCVNADVAARIRAAVRDLGVDSCWVAATHTHASPEAGCAPGGAPTPASLAERLVLASARAVRAALADERDARLHAVRVHVPGLGDRRALPDPQAVDLPVDALVVSSGAGEVVGVVAVSPVHPTVLPETNREVSADLTGGIRRALQGGDRWVVVATGAAGDISTRHTRRARDRAEIDRLGATVAEHLPLTAPPQDGLERPSVVAPASARPRPSVLAPASARVRLDPKRPEDLAAALAEAADARDAGERHRSVLRQGRAIARDLRSRGRTQPYEIEVEAVRLGDVTLVAVPGELFLDLGEAVRARSAPDGSPVIVLGYTNGYLGYLPSRGTPTSYETLVSPVAEGSGERVVEAAVEAVAASARPMAESRFAAGAGALVDRVLATQMPAIRRAAGLVADALAAGGVLQTFATGHSRAVALELTGRAGGLAAVSMLAVKDLVMFGGVDPALVLDPTYERTPGLAERIYALAEPDPADVFLIVSNSGINAAIVEMAQLARANGHRVIALTSLDHTRSSSARSVGGPHLADLADVVIDNCAPAGDATIELAPGTRIGAVSSFTGVLIAQVLAELVCRALLERGADLPVFVSANLASGDRHNAALYERYRGRVRPLEP
ncbi:sugar isomerase domain-containing protein [Nonomuraea phyllanthi]|uniref:sugar isomerase domain-containing protein n=1 Tax=Nonomuraea phyllanthi TaxID=2219224 RepID=UPI001D002F16|nr:SIS domain-containing protein [Nonomuraea phyllanthi]